MIDQIIPNHEFADSFFWDSPSGIAVIGADDKYIIVNDAYSRITGYMTNELSEKTWKMIVHPEDVPGLEKRAQDIQKHRIRRTQATVRKLTKHGKTVICDITIFAHFSQNVLTHWVVYAQVATNGMIEKIMKEKTDEGKFERFIRVVKENWPILLALAVWDFVTGGKIAELLRTISSAFKVFS